MLHCRLSWDRMLGCRLSWDRRSSLYHMLGCRSSLVVLVKTCKFKYRLTAPKPGSLVPRLLSCRKRGRGLGMRLETRDMVLVKTCKVSIHYPWFLASYPGPFPIFLQRRSLVLPGFINTDANYSTLMHWM